MTHNKTIFLRPTKTYLQTVARPWQIVGEHWQLLYCLQSGDQLASQLHSRQNTTARCAGIISNHANKRSAGIITGNAG